MAHNSRLLLAVHREDVKAIKKALKDGADVNFTDQHGKFPLLIAASGDGHDLVNLLIKMGALVNQQNSTGLSALMRASERNSYEIVKSLLAQGADVGLQDSKGETALMMACRNTDLTSFEALLRASSANQVNLQNDDGETALHIAAQASHHAERRDYLERIKLLLKGGAQVDLKDNDGSSSLILACQHRYAEIDAIMCLLNEGANVNLKDKKGNTPLLAYIDGCGRERNQKINLECLEVLVKAGAKIDAQNEKGQTILMKICASYFVRESITVNGLLKDYSAQVNLEDKQGNTALMFACRNKHGACKTVEVLLKNGAKINSQNKLGDTPLINASRLGETDLVKLLLESGKAGVNLKNNDGQSALMTASEMGRLDIVTSLLQGGAEIDLRNSKGQSALLLGAKRGHHFVVNELIKQGARINLQDNEGYSALMMASQCGHYDTTAYLLKEDADMCLTDSEGKTAFDIATNRKDASIISLFSKFSSKAAHPGILSQGVKRETITASTEKTFDLKEVGNSLSASTDPPQVRPCISGPFKAPGSQSSLHCEAQTTFQSPHSLPVPVMFQSPHPPPSQTTFQSSHSPPAQTTFQSPHSPPVPATFQSPHLPPAPATFQPHPGSATFQFTNPDVTPRSLSLGPTHSTEQWGVTTFRPSAEGISNTTQPATSVVVRPKRSHTIIGGNIATGLRHHSSPTADRRARSRQRATIMISHSPRAQAHHDPSLPIYSATTFKPAAPSHQPPPTPEPAVLTVDDTADVCRCLFPLQARWIFIGNMLLIEDISLATIKADKDNVLDRLTAMVGVWLRRHTPPPTWQALAYAVELLDPDKAQEIRQMHAQ